MDGLVLVPSSPSLSISFANSESFWTRFSVAEADTKLFALRAGSVAIAWWAGLRLGMI